MEQKILIAEPREVIRAGIRAILEQDEQIKNIYEVSTSEEIGKHLHSYNIDLIIVHQSFVAAFNLLPMNKFILLADEPDIDMFLKAYTYKVRGYLSTSISSELLLATVHTTQNACLLDPVFLPWIVSHIQEHMQIVQEFSHLSHREWEIAQLMKSGIDRKTIAQQLHISEATLKTHLKNIAHKQAKNQTRPDIPSGQTKSRSLREVESLKYPKGNRSAV